MMSDENEVLSVPPPKGSDPLAMCPRERGGGCRDICEALEGTGGEVAVAAGTDAGVAGMELVSQESGSEEGAVAADGKICFAG